MMSKVMSGYSLVKNEIKKYDFTILYVLAAVFMGYFLLHDLLGGTFFSHCAWDSYTLQAMAWRNGRVSLGQDYSYLELAIYNNDWYVSFPPVPSVFMLPWTYFYGYETPNNLIMIIYVMITIFFAYLVARHFKMSAGKASFYACFLVLGSNMLWMSTMGGVWFQAQLLSMMLCTIGIYAMLKHQRVIAYLCIALAVGCRPFSIVYFLVLLVWFYHKDKKEHKKGFFMTWLYQIEGWFAAAVVGASYMVYNYVRFKDPFEFGHNYLPEFLEAENGQFSSVYFMENIKNIFTRSIDFEENGKLIFTQFDGFLFYIANPMFLIFFGCLIVCIIRKWIEMYKHEKLIITRNFVAMGMIVVALILNTCMLCVHKTFGGWQFGCRYMCDLLPFTYLFIMLAKKNKDKLTGLEILIGLFAFFFNLYGTMWMNIV